MNDKNKKYTINIGYNHWGIVKCFFNNINIIKLIDVLIIKIKTIPFLLEIFDLKISQKYFYWKLNHKFNGSIFYLKRFLFNRKKNFIHIQEDYYNIFNIIKSIYKLLFFTTFIIVLFWFLEKYLKNFSGYKDLKIDDKSLFDFYKTISTIVGAFLGLYFTATSIIAQTIYSKIQGDIRALLLADKFGNFYIKSLVGLFAYSLSLSILSLFEVNFGFSNLVFLSLWSFLSLFSFWNVSISIFRFFDPSSLINSYIIPDIVEFLKLSSEKKEAYDKNFQNSARINVYNKIDLYKNIVTFSTKQKHLQKDSLKKIISHTVDLLTWYESIKSKIPSESLWFPEEFEHKVFFEESYEETKMYLALGGFPNPKNVKNNNWFEKELLEIINVSLQNFYKIKSLNEYYSLLFKTINSFSHYISFNRLDEAYYLYDNLYNPFKFQSLKDNDNKYVFAINDLYVTFYQIVIISYIKSISKININQISTNQLLSNSFIYNKNYPRQLLTLLEDFQKKIKLEKSTNGKIITTDLYVKNSLLSSLSNLIEEDLNNFLDRFENKLRNIKDDISNSHYLSIISFYGLDSTYRKMIANLGNVKSKYPNIDFSKIDERLIAIDGSLLDLFIAIIPFLFPSNKDYPDYFGKAYDLLNIKICESLAHNKQDDFDKIFNTFFIYSMKAIEHIRQKSLESNNVYYNYLHIEMWKNFFSILGYIILFDEINDRDNKKLIILNLKNLNFLESKTIEHFCLLINLAFNSFMNHTQRSTSSFHINSVIQEELYNKKLLKRRSFDFYSTKNKRSKPMTLTEAICEDSYDFGIDIDDGLSIFIVNILWDYMDEVQKDEVIKNYKVRDLKRKLEESDEE